VLVNCAVERLFGTPALKWAITGSEHQCSCVVKICPARRHQIDTPVSNFL
jgi:hypothetical protein